MNIKTQKEQSSCPTWCQQDETCSDCGGVKHYRMYESQVILVGTNEEDISRDVMRILDDNGQEFFQATSPFGDFKISRNPSEPKDEWEHRAFSALTYNQMSFANQVESMMALQILTRGDSDA